MFEVVGYEEVGFEGVLRFIRKVSPDAVLDEEIVRNAVLIRSGDEVVGSVAYEARGDVGVIRYFVYDGGAVTDAVVGMFFELYRRAKESGVVQLVGVAPGGDVYLLFEMLGFVQVRKDVPDAASHLLGVPDANVMMIRL